MERWVYDSDSGRPGRRRGLFVWLLDVAFAVVTALVALLLLFMYLAPYVSPCVVGLFRGWARRAGNLCIRGRALPLLGDPLAVGLCFADARAAAPGGAENIALL